MTFISGLKKFPEDSQLNFRSDFFNFFGGSHLESSFPFELIHRREKEIYMQNKKNALT